MFRSGWPLVCCVVIGLFAPSGPHPSRGCTDFRVKTEDGTILVGRTLDFDLPVLSQIRVFPRGRHWTSEAPGGRKGVSWTQQYGFVAIDIGGRAADLFGIVSNVADGLNEKGLSFGWLSMPDYTRYQDEEAARDPEHAIAHWDLSLWVLGRFATVAEVREAVAKVHVWGKPMLPLNLVMPLHASIHDPSGASLVLEFTADGPKIYDNLVGVLTNAPTYDWHITNLRNFLNLRAISAGPVKVGNSVLSPIGSGSGFLGIPGDWTPPSRFVRISAMKYFAWPARDAAEGVTLVAHLLQTVNIPQGVERVIEDPQRSDYTRWSVIKDLRNRVLYFRGYDSHTLRAIHLRKLDFSPQAKRRTIPVADDGGILDVTDSLRD